MNELAIFTPEVAEALIAKGYKPVEKTKSAWLFKDSAAIRKTVEKLLEAFEINNS